jgi:hypothetical protein
MAVSQSSNSAARVDLPPARTGGFRGTRLWLVVAGCFLTAVAIAIGLAASAYQPLGFWNRIGGFPGLHRPAGAHIVNDFGQTGQLYIPHQHWTFAASVSLVNKGSFPVTIEAVSMVPPGTDYPRMLIPAGQVLYWTTWMTTGQRQGEHGRPIAGLVLRPGNSHGIYVAIPVRTPRCYISGALGVLSYFYVKERFGPFTKWVKVPLIQPLMLNAPAAPANQPGPDTVCPGS